MSTMSNEEAAKAANATQATQASFYCPITTMQVTQNNLEKWRITLRSALYTIPPAYKQIMNNFGATTKEEYFEIIKNAMNDNTINNLVSAYNKKRKSELKLHEQYKAKMLQEALSKSFHKISDTIHIQMLLKEHQKDAIRLYTLFKKTMEEDTKVAKEYTEDFILKNNMFGIFVDNVLAGFVITDSSKKILIDEYDHHIETFYIQEMLIHPKYRGQHLSKHLIEYSIKRCPDTSTYISLMTMPTNTPLIRSATSCGFVQQNNQSGDPKHSLLMILKRN